MKKAFELLNEGFERVYMKEDTTSSTSSKEELRKALQRTCDDLMNKHVVNIKTYEIAFQDTIEKLFPDKPWWQVTGCDIFWHLFNERNPYKTVDEIIAQFEKKEEDMSEDTHYVKNCNGHTYVSIDGKHWEECSYEEYREYLDGGYEEVFCDEAVNKEVKSLQEFKQRYILKNSAKLRRACRQGDLQGVIDALKASYEELYKQKLIDEDDFNNWVEELDYIDETEDEINYQLDEFYDLCDNIGVWVSLD